MSKTQEVKRLQWIKGDKIGNVEVIESESAEWVTFQSGGRISKSILGEFMMDIGNGDPIIDNVNNELTKVVNAKPTPPTEPVRPTATETPIMSLFKKMENTENHSLNFSVNISIPGKDVYNILAKSFGDDVIKDTLEEYIINQLTDEVLKDAIQESITDTITSFKMS
jgi:hypothetical protein